MTISIGRVVAALIVIVVFIRTVSYSAWVWKQKNRIGAVMALLLAVSALVLPLYLMFIR